MKVYLQDTKIKEDPKCLKEIKDRQAMAVKASKIAKFEIVDFMNLKNLELGSYPHTYISNKIIECFKKYKPDIVYTHYEYDLNIDHYHTFFLLSLHADLIIILK